MSDQEDTSRETNAPQIAAYVKPRHDTYPFIDPTSANLAGKSVFITGASKGIGKAAALAFATAGCSKIAIAARSPLDDVEKAIREAAAKENHPEPLILSLTVDTFSGSLDILICNAGYLEDWRKLAESQADDWWKSWEVNMKGTYLCHRYFIPLVLESQTKTIINCSSIGGHLILPGASGYQTAKFAMARFTEFADKEYHQQGLIAINLHPGGVATELGQRMPKYLHQVLIDPPELAAHTVCWDMQELEQKKDEILQKNALKVRIVL
ncbi:short chain dehydrogenase domain-containing protein [Trichoderma breve]|uniref:Short chain dehydrogenase domain-containing protein n=1 Tax=Trichoderma breve TaxID=2034170 RepID=A0A9W9BDG5_9HYPO|nr:short chain dehydrogenase domain-containing protein [Trichoderma breve]KAJ4861248.1 short chain dehydrogenase domain-containing protein [Trichoderma breve]